MTLARQIPNFLTLCNLLCGCLGILYAQEFPLYLPAYLVWIACTFDFFDGFAARAFKSSSLIGKELDSLADMVSFGVLPSMVMYSWMDHYRPGDILNYLAFLIAAFSALRLAKFNIDENQRDHFIGLPTPANAIFITGLVFLEAPFNILTSHYVGLIITTLIFSLLLVAPFNLFALKFKNYRWNDNKIRFTFIIISVLLLGWMQASALPLIILLYLALSLVEGALIKK